MSGRNDRQKRQRTPIPNRQGRSNEPPEVWIPTGQAPSPVVFEQAEQPRPSSTNRGRTPGGSLGVHKRSHPIEQRETWLPSGRSPSPLVFEQSERTERRAPQPTFPTPVSPPRDSGPHPLFEEPRAPWARAGADIPIRPRSPQIPRPNFGASQPEYTRAPHPTPTFVYPGPPSPEPVQVTFHKPPARHSPPHPPIVVQPPRPQPDFITVGPAQVPHPAPPAPRPILRRDSAGPRQRRPSESGTTPVVRIEAPQTFNERPAAHFIPDEEELPWPHPPHWTWPDRSEGEPLANAQNWSGHQPHEPSWYGTGGQPHESQHRNRSGRSHRGSQSSAQPHAVRKPPSMRSPPQEREYGQSSTFVSNDPFKVQTPLQRRKHEGSHGKDDASLNFDSIPLPGERMPTDTHPPAIVVVGAPSDEEEKIENQTLSEYGSQHSGVSSKSSRTQSMLSSTTVGQITNHVITVVPFILATLAGQAYVLVMLRLPSLYFTRVARIFEEADLSVEDLKNMALKIGSEDRGWSWSKYEFDSKETGDTPRYTSLKKTWSDFIDSVMQEWNTFNIISVLLLSAILTILQIQAAAVDPITRYTALSSLLCALMSLLYGCTYIVRFGTMRKTYKAFEWALEAKNKQRLWWNVWVMLAMPAVWLTWSIILYIACIMSFIWRTSPEDDGSNPIALSPESLLIIRVVLSSVLGIGVFYSLLILTTFRRYGLVMDRTWQKRIDEWVERKEAQYYE